MVAGVGKSNTREIQLRLLRVRWRNAGIARNRRLPTFGTHSTSGAYHLYGGKGRWFRRSRWVGRQRMMKGDSNGLQFKLPLLSNGLSVTVSGLPY